MASMKVGTRLGLGFGAVIVLLIVVALLGITNMRSIQGQLDDIVNDEFPKTVHGSRQDCVKQRCCETRGQAENTGHRW